MLVVGCEVLRSFGYGVLSSQAGSWLSNGSESMPTISTCSYLDVLMAVQDGRQVAEQMLALRPDVRLLFVTGYDKLEVLSWLERITSGDTLIQPCSAGAFSRTIRRRLDN